MSKWLPPTFRISPVLLLRKRHQLVKEAFHLQYNWIAMAGAGVFALLSGTFLPIILAGGLEMMYLAIVPQNSRFRRLIRSWKFAEEQRKHQEKLNEMLEACPPKCRAAMSTRRKCAVRSAPILPSCRRIADLSAADRPASGLLNRLCPFLAGGRSAAAVREEHRAGWHQARNRDPAESL